jgi:fatty-acyl-CoA synthase
MNRLLTISDALARHARLSPNKLGARDSQRSLSFAQWEARSLALAGGLQALGLQKGDRVAVLAYNRVEWMEIYTALSASGLVAVPINFRLMTPEIAYILEHCEAKALIVQDSLLERVVDLVPHPDLAVQHLIVMGPAASTQTLRYEDLMSQGPQSFHQVVVEPADLCAILYTSGTTGRPKGVMRSHEGSSLIALATALEMRFGPEDVGLMVMPLCHANSMYFSQTFLHLGATCVIDDSTHFDPELTLAKLANERISFTSLVPTHYIMMLALPGHVRAAHDVTSVDKLMISSAPARKDTKLAIMACFPNARLHELYGSTEAGWVTLLRPEEQLDHLGSVGREWMGSGPIRLLDEHGQEVPDGEVGELFSRTPYAFDGYWQNPEKTAEAFRGEWCSVGDMARRDENGFIQLVDRKSNMIISGGENIYPSEVEGVIGSCPGVKDVAVVGVPHDKWGEAVHAVVVLHQGATLSETEVIEWCRTRMAGFKRPQTVSLISDDQMPRNATGKILHRVLREQLVRALTDCAVAA